MVKNRALVKIGTSRNKSRAPFGKVLTMFLFCSSNFSKQQARAEQEEEFISNTLFKKIQALQKEKETLAVNYEKEEEFLTNELSRKLMQVNGLVDLLRPTHTLAFLSSPHRAFPFTCADAVVAWVWGVSKHGVRILQTVALEPTCSGRVGVGYEFHTLVCTS